MKDKICIKETIKGLMMIMSYIIIINLLLTTYIGYKNHKIEFELSKFNLGGISSFYDEYIFGNKKAFNQDEEELEEEYIDFRQSRSYNSSAASLRYLLYYFAMDPSEEELVELIGIDQSGVKLEDLIKAIDSLGLEGEVVKGDFYTLKEIELPIIAIIKNNHYVVITKVGEDYLHIFDPEFGVIEVPERNFLNVWSEILIRAGIKPILSYEGEEI